VIRVKFVCPSCGRTNVVPDVWNGNCFVCRKCETQVTAPSLPDARARPWLTSPGWLAVVGLAVVAVAGCIGFTLLSLSIAPSADLPFVDDVGPHGPQLALPGGTLLITWEPGIRSAGGTYRIVRQDIRFVLSAGRAVTPVVRANPQPWPADILDSTQGAAAEPVTIRLEITLPDQADLEGLHGTLHAAVTIEYPVQPEPTEPAELARAQPSRSWNVTIATAEQARRFADVAGTRHAALIAAIVCGVLAAATIVAAAATAEKTITVICPECGRATDATYVHSRGAIRVTPCPHRRG